MLAITRGKRATDVANRRPGLNDREAIVEIPLRVIANLGLFLVTRCIARDVTERKRAEEEALHAG